MAREARGHADHRGRPDRGRRRIARRSGTLYVPGGGDVERADIDGGGDGGDDGGSASPRTPDEGAIVDIALAYGAFGDRFGGQHYAVTIDRPMSSSIVGGDGDDEGGGRCGDGGGGLHRGATMEHFAFSAGMASADGVGVGANDEGSPYTERCRCGDGDVGANADACTTGRYVPIRRKGRAYTTDRR